MSILDNNRTSAITTRIRAFLNNIWVALVLKVILTTTLILGFVAILFGIPSDSPSVVVEINDIPFNWLVDFLYERTSEDVLPTTGLRANVVDSVIIHPNQHCKIVGSEYYQSDETYVSHVGLSGTFIVDGEYYNNAFLVVDPWFSEVLQSDDDALYYVEYPPIIKFTSISDTNSRNAFELKAHLDGDSVYHRISLDFSSFYFNLAASRHQSDVEVPFGEALSADLMLMGTSGFILEFEQCNAFLLGEDFEIPISQCEYVFDNNNDVLIIASNEEDMEEYSYSIEIPIKNDFTVGASKFQDMYLYGVGELSISNTAKINKYALNDHLVELHHNPEESVRDNIYTFEHKYDRDTGDSTDLFRLNTYVTTATIAGESVIPNFWSWFRDIVYDDPLSLALAIIGEVAIFGFIGQKDKKKKEDE